MKQNVSGTPARRVVGALMCAVAAAAITSQIAVLGAQSAPTTGASAVAPPGVPELQGMWDGGGRARPVNSENYPWTKENFPVLNERAMAYQKVFDEITAPKYDCQPSTSPAIQYDPYIDAGDAVAGPGHLPLREGRSDADRLAGRPKADRSGHLAAGIFGRRVRATTASS